MKMPFRMDVRNKLITNSDRVKDLDQHSEETWILYALYDGSIQIWNYETQMQIKTFKVCKVPVRSAKFVPRKNWVVTGSDDMKIKIYNYNTLEKVYSFEAHTDYIRNIAVHPTLPFIFTSSDDMLIKLWNWNKNWTCQQIYKDHSYSVMQVAINPKNNDTFASASLDKTIKLWQTGSSAPNFTLKGHKAGVNCINYHVENMPLLVSGGDDFLIKIWDYQNKTCIRTLNGHFGNVTAVLFHPKLPYILSGSEDGTVNIWHATTYKPKTLINQSKGRVWAMSSMRDSSNIAIGYDEGVIMIQIGSEEPPISLDVVGGKITWTKHYDLQQINLKALPDAVKDGEYLRFAEKDVGSCEFYPQTIAYNSNGRFLAVCGEGEYIIYTAMALRNKAFGPAQEFVWADNSDYAILEYSTVRVFRNFQEWKCFTPDSGVKRIFGGHLLGVMDDSKILSFYEWGNLKLVSQMELVSQARLVYWAANGELVCLVTDEVYYVLKYNASAVGNAKANSAITLDCIENAFELVREVNEIVLSGVWIGECFAYTNSKKKLNYDVAGKIVTVINIDCTMYILGYVSKENRLYLSDKKLNITSYILLRSVLEYQVAVMNKCTAKSTLEVLLSTIPRDLRKEVDHFTDKYAYVYELEHNFQCALSVGNLKEAKVLAESIATVSDISSSKSSAKWTRLGDSAIAANDIELAKTCYIKAKNFSSLLLLASCTGEQELLKEVADTAVSEGQYNVAFTAYFTLNDIEGCFNLLLKQKLLAEAAIFARSYIPSKMSETVEKWRFGADKKLGQSLADPLRYGNLFPEYKESLTREEFQKFGLQDKVEDFKLISDRDSTGNVEDLDEH